eukprot:CAMPEP_0116888916 /NCGR_PEP_ID=MMETSP0463-20121206/24194_1 /TAXON_ID=181622 /ORGANISM="Strombidinopsis sp, Strain SopsisLIS2011" /LENGTH=72 /DNA_ID=CAMNT_0004554671 /DNA_START=342 /DNA_END=560 /DNA_ORIENTATION=+
MIEYYNSHQGLKHNITLSYSTPSIYIDAIKNLDVKWPTKYDDMFPYSGDNGQTYWTGFYTRRPNSKDMMHSF